MKRWLLALAFVLGGTATQAQIVTPPAYDGGSVTNPFLAPDGCVAPGYSFTNAPTRGVCHNAGEANILSMVAPALNVYGFYTDASNYEGFQMTASANIIYLRPISAGTGWDDFDVRLESLGAGIIVFEDEATMGGIAGTDFIIPNGQLKVHPGTVTNPAIAWQGDLTTGIFSETTSEINFTSQGAEIFEARYNGSTSTVWQFIGQPAAEAAASLSATATEYTWTLGNPAGGGSNVDIRSRSADTWFLMGSSTQDGEMYLFGPDPKLTFDDDVDFVDYTVLVAEDQTGVATITVPHLTGTMEVQQASEPTCDATTRGQIAFVAGATLVADTYRVCAKSSTDTYAWYALATIP